MENLEKVDTTLRLCCPFPDPNHDFPRQETENPMHGSATVMNHGSTIHTSWLGLNLSQEFDSKDQQMIDEEEKKRRNSVSVSGRTMQLLKKSDREAIDDGDLQLRSLDLSLSLNVGSSVLDVELKLSRGGSTAPAQCSTKTRAPVVLSPPDVERNRHDEGGIDLDLKLGFPTTPTLSTSRRRVEVRIERNDDAVIGDDGRHLHHVGGDHNIIDPWVIKKEITKSDVGGQARLLIGLNLVRRYILPQLVDYLDLIHESDEGLRVMVFDCDTNTSHHLKFKWWKSSNSYVLIDGWTQHFVTRRGLKRGDKIGLRCSAFGTDNVSFFFAVLSRVADT